MLDLSKLAAHTSFVVQPAGWNMGFHNHQRSIEISAVLQGKGEFECLGQVYPIEPGHVVVIPPDVPHSYRAKTDMRFAVLETEYPPPETMKLFRKLTLEGQPSLLYLSPISLEHYDQLFRIWLRIISSSVDDRASLIKAWTEVIIQFMWQYRSLASTSNSMMETADYIRENLRSEISIASLAHQCGLSDSTYRVAFKAAFGYSPKQYQQSCRMAESKWLLRTTNLPIQQVAEQVGFAKLHSFSAWFHRNIGMPPSEWRKLQQVIYSVPSN